MKSKEVSGSSQTKAPAQKKPYKKPTLKKYDQLHKIALGS